MVANRLYAGKNNVMLSGVINSVWEIEVAGYRVVHFETHCTSSYYNKKDNETKTFTQRIPCVYWDKAGTASIEPGSYIHADGQISIDKQSGVHVKVRGIEKVFTDNNAIDLEHAKPYKRAEQFKKDDPGSYSELPPLSDDDLII